jgi:predicted nucleic-acid-binding Zn-ribbon protein
MSFEVGASGPAYTLVICDRCGMTEEYEDGRIYVVADVATESGWSVESNDHAVCPKCAPSVDDEGEQFLRDREIDIRISASGEPL